MTQSFVFCKTAKLSKDLSILYKKCSFLQNYSVNCTNLEAKMKTLAAFLLLSAFAAYVSAIQEIIYCKAVINFLDERHDERMAQFLRDNGLPEDTLVASDRPEPPDFIVSRLKYFNLNIFLLVE